MSDVYFKPYRNIGPLILAKNAVLSESRNNEGADKTSIMMGETGSKKRG
jgi:hypothetical protein